MEMASSSMPASSRMMLIISRTTHWLSETARSTAEPFSTRPTVEATQEKRPAQVTTSMTTAVARMLAAKISTRMLMLLMVR